MTWTKEDIHTGSGHEVRVWKEGNVTRIMTANHALQGGTAELRVWSGQ